MSLVSQEVHDQTVAELLASKTTNETLTAEKTALEARVETLEEAEKAHTEAINTITAEKEAAVTAKAELDTQVQTQTTRISELEAENAELRKGPGAKTATTVTKTNSVENSDLSDYDKLEAALKAAETPAEKARISAEFKAKRNK